MKALRGTRGLAAAVGIASVVLVGVAPAALATTSDTTPPTAPAAVSASRSGDNVFVSWSASTDNTGVTGYDVMVDGGAPIAVTTTGYTHVGAYKVDHTYGVRAKDAAGNVSAYSTVTYNSATGLATSDLTGGAGAGFFGKITSYFKDHVIVAVLALFALTVGVGVLMGWGRKAATSK